MRTQGDADIPVGMEALDALRVVAELRGDRTVVVTNQGSARLWPRIAQHPLDFHYNPSTMGGAIPLGLGMALAYPDREIIVVSGDGGLLMSLGSLVTVAASGATNLTAVVMDNGRYEVTGGQCTPGAAARVDFAGIARSAGFPTAGRYCRIEDWRDAAPGVLGAAGPRLVDLQVAPLAPGALAGPALPTEQQLDRLRKALG